jgi:hypothetical protein
MRVLENLGVEVGLSTLLLLALTSCGSSTTETEAKLLFKSGFEEDVYIDPVPVRYSEDYDFIRGAHSLSTRPRTIRTLERGVLALG